MNDWGASVLLLVGVFGVALSVAWRFGGRPFPGEPSIHDPRSPVLPSRLLPASVSCCLLAAALLARELAPPPLARLWFLALGFLWFLSIAVLYVLERTRPMWLLPARLQAPADATEADQPATQPLAVPRAIWWGLAAVLGGVALAVPLIHLPPQWIIGLGFGVAALLKLRRT